MTIILTEPIRNDDVVAGSECGRFVVVIRLEHRRTRIIKVAGPFAGFDELYLAIRDAEQIRDLTARLTS
jgi:hypothetical protein